MDNATESRMKIALNIERIGAAFGGAEKYAAALARHLADDGHEIHVVARQVQPGELPEAVTVRPIRISRLPGLKWLRAYRFGLASERLLNSEAFDLVLGFDKTWHQDAHLALGGVHQATLEYSSRRFRSPAVRGCWRVGKLLSPKQWAFRVISRKQFHSNRSSLIVAPSRMVAEHFQQYHRLSPERIAVVYNGLDGASPIEDPNAVRREFRRRHGLREDDVAALFVARNYALKGLSPLLEAFAPIAWHQPKARLIVCGSPRDRRYRAQADELGLEDRVLFLGFMEDVRACFAACDIFAFPTFYDPCSLVVLEAMQAGLPVITTRQNGAAELMVNGREGFVIDSPWQLDQMQRALSLLIADQALRQDMGAHAAAAAEGLSIERRLDELTAVLSQLAAGDQPAPIARSAA